MKRFIKIFTAFAIVFSLLFSITAFAASEKIITSDVKVKKDRLFEVKIGFKSSRTITAARFTLKYNPDDIAVREPVCNLSNAKVRHLDSNGTTDIIFLCSHGVKCGEFPALFSMKYKKLTDNNTKVSITASDCVDKNKKNFTPPSSAVCVVKAYTSSDTGTGFGGSSGKRSGGSGSSGRTNYYNNDEEDIIETSSNDGNSKTDEEDNLLDYSSGDDDSVVMKIVPYVLLAILLLFIGVILYQNIQLKKAEKRRAEEQEKPQQDDKKE